MRARRHAGRGRRRHCGVEALADALADRDTIHAVIRGAAVNNDGAGKAGYTAPSVDGQVEVIAMAQALAGVDPRSISYVEAHGTATPLGDPIEVAALTQVFRASTSDVGFCQLGSLKANLGHLDAAAGVAGLIKTVMALSHGEIPPSANFQSPNPQLDLARSPFCASAEGRPGHRVQRHVVPASVHSASAERMPMWCSRKLLRSRQRRRSGRPSAGAVRQDCFGA